MEPTFEDVLRGFEEATEFVRHHQFEMTEDYIRLIEQVEALPQNAPGSRKTPGWHAVRPRVAPLPQPNPAQ